MRGALILRRRRRLQSANITIRLIPCVNATPPKYTHISPTDRRYLPIKTVTQRLRQAYQRQRESY